MKVRAIKLNKLQNPNIFWSLVAGLIVFVGLYFYMVNLTVWNVVARQKAEKQITLLNSATGDMESSYMAAKNNINLNLAETMGFAATTNTKYVTRTKLGRLSSNSVE